MKKEVKIKGEFYHIIQELGNKKYEHIGFKDNENKFQDMMESIVPQVGMTKKAIIKIEIIE